MVPEVSLVKYNKSGNRKLCPSMFAGQDPNRLIAPSIFIAIGNETMFYWFSDNSIGNQFSKDILALPERRFQLYPLFQI